ncbi:MAG: 3-hydroxybutyrate dehydrogenase [Gammaproteobacteria bacterium HGW-Gammaproteobacteria-14]|nr:MAG: 3-hydroxybutyrate dehydrogenase [Gammaproteobacteria bacterium HGW-Gammaproteobacteria-14]
MQGINLEQSVVAITGAGRGIGLAIAKRLAAAGARISIGDIDVALAQQAAAAVDGFAGSLDVRSPASMAAWLQATEAALGPVDVIINNAGIMPAGAFLDESDALSDTQIDINLRGVIHGCKLALPGMVARGRGHVVNVASMAGRLAVPGLAVYCATKFAVVGLTETLREEYRDSGVAFTTVLPAKVTTELASGTDTAARGVPTVTPEEVAEAVYDALMEQLPEVTLPRYLSVLNPLQSAAPHWLLRGVRTVFGDRRVLEKMDALARASYDQRIGALTKKS